MNQAPYEMDSDSRVIVLRTLAEVCSHRGWNLLAAHVRTNHVHVIVEAEVQPEKVMTDFKAYASRALNRLDGNEPAGDDGRVMEARDGCGGTRMFVRRSAMWWSSKASLWRSSWGPCPEAANRLAYARGSVARRVKEGTVYDVEIVDYH